MSVAAKVPAAVVPSLGVEVPVSPAVNTGAASLTSWTLTVTVIVSVLAPSVTWITTAQVLELSPAPQPASS